MHVAWDDGDLVIRKVQHLTSGVRYHLALELGLGLELGVEPGLGDRAEG